MVAQIFQKISIWIIVIPFLIGLLNYEGLNRDSKWIFLLVALALPPQLITAIINKENALLNISYNLYIPIEFWILYTIFFPKFNTSAGRTLLHVSASLFIAVYLVVFFLVGPQKRFFNEVLCLTNLFYILWILWLLQQELNAEPTIIVRNNPFTWYLIAILIYTPTTVASFALYYYIREPSKSFDMNITIINSAFNILLYLLYSVGLLISKAKT